MDEPNDKKDSKPLTITIVKHQKECLHGHNVIRKLYGVKELKWDNNLQYEAEQWALRLALKGKMTQSGYVDEDGDRYGENLYHYTGGDGRLCSHALHYWYKGYEKFDFNNLKPLYNSFTQLIWDETTKVGVGVATVGSHTWVVARYKPGMLATAQNFKDHIKSAKGDPNILLSHLIPEDNPKPFYELIEITKQSSETECSDKEKNCAYWMKNGFCLINPPFMKNKCAKTCGMCKGSPIDGGWTKWASATSCKGTCGQGRFEEHRFCINPPPINDGDVCPGDKRRYNVCQLEKCDPSSNCMDLDKRCRPWSKKYCGHIDFGNWMSHNCKKSCGLCK